MKPTGIIVLDGPDGTGKTTLAKELVRKYDARYIHLTYRWKNNMFEYNVAAVDYAARLAEQGHLVIIDRLWMSDNIYDTVFRGRVISPHLGRYVERLILKYSGIYVICLPESSRDYLNHFNELKSSRIEMYDSMEAIYQGYSQMWDKVTRERWPHAFRYDMFTDGQNLPEYATKIAELAQASREEAYQPGLSTSCKGFAGSLAHGSVMFISEQPTLRKGQVFYPRVAKTEANELFNGILDLAGVPEWKLMWTSVDQEHIWKELLSAYDIRPMTLGISAYQKIVKDANHYHYYGRPDNFITPEYDLAIGGNSTFMQRMIYQLNLNTGEHND
jgi:thymidylate kinase